MHFRVSSPSNSLFLAPYGRGKVRVKSPWQIVTGSPSQLAECLKARKRIHEEDAMRKIAFAFLPLFFAALGMIFAQARQTVEPGSYAGEPQPYIVQENDTLWALEGSYSGRPAQWQRLVDHNPFLEDKGRAWVDKQGRSIVLLHPGEELFGLEELGILPKRLPLNQLQLAQAPVVTAQSAPATSEVGHWSWVGKALLYLAIALLAIAAIAGLLYEIQKRKLRRNPVTAGPPFVEGGVSDQMARTAFQDMAARTFVRETGRTLSPQRFQVLNIQRGRAFGIWRVAYRDGSQADFNMGAEGRIAYRATARFPEDAEGRVRELHMLQACANDLLYSNISNYLPGGTGRFVPDTEVAAPPEPRPHAMPARPAPQLPEFPTVAFRPEGVTVTFPSGIVTIVPQTVAVTRRGNVMIFTSFGDRELMRFDLVAEQTAQAQAMPQEEAAAAGD